MFVDARIPVRFLEDHGLRHCPGPQPELETALILPAGSAMPGGWAATRALPAFAPHPSGCACCGGRSEVALMLIALFQARARGEVGFFRSVVAILPIEEASALRRMLMDDAFLSGCFVAIG